MNPFSYLILHLLCRISTLHILRQTWFWPVAICVIKRIFETSTQISCISNTPFVLYIMVQSSVLTEIDYRGIKYTYALPKHEVYSQWMIIGQMENGPSPQISHLLVNSKKGSHRKKDRMLCVLVFVSCECFISAQLQEHNYLKSLPRPGCQFFCPRLLIPLHHYSHRSCCESLQDVF